MHVAHKHTHATQESANTNCLCTRSQIHVALVTTLQTTAPGNSRVPWTSLLIFRFVCMCCTVAQCSYPACTDALHACVSSEPPPSPPPRRRPASLLMCSGTSQMQLPTIQCISFLLTQGPAACWHVGLADACNRFGSQKTCKGRGTHAHCQGPKSKHTQPDAATRTRSTHSRCWQPAAANGHNKYKPCT